MTLGNRKGARKKRGLTASTANPQEMINTSEQEKFIISVL